MSEPSPPADLAARAAAVLRANDLGGWTKAAPRLYPHQWSWDSAFIAVGWARLDPVRALRELETILGAQWATGMVPHIVYNPDAPPGGYFPDAERWDCARLNPAAPRAVATSGICQPPVHA
ncbi:MAG: glycogen debranching protein, partial [Chloroflexota bacterium]|nr:glycogen debranching protein [Chloroflexota bacterium]